MTENGIGIGDRAPAFGLPNVDGQTEALDELGGKAATVVYWTCNHCPYALAWHDRIADVARDYADRGVRVLAINPNDGARYPADSYEAMQQRVRDEEWPMPYLHDESQEVAHAYGAKTTPDVFVVAADSAIAYRGAPDADSGDPGLDAAWLRAALDDVLAGRPVDRAETKPVGCSIKWKP
jgi:peroxiredoxin